MSGIEETVRDRFWAKVAKSAGCWLWRGARGKNGYGTFKLDGRSALAHRIAWQLSTGEELPRGGVLLHVCDTPLCVRPEHLRVGSYAENTADARAKGRLVAGDRHYSRTNPERLARGLNHGRHTKPERTARGERNGQAKLNAEAVRTIRARYSTGEASQRQLAREYGIGQTNVREILARRTWTHV